MRAFALSLLPLASPSAAFCPPPSSGSRRHDQEPASAACAKCRFRCCCCCCLRIYFLTALTVSSAIPAGITEDGKDSAAAMDHAFKWILIWGGILSVVLFILWPCLALPAKVFSKGYFTFVRLFTPFSHIPARFE